MSTLYTGLNAIIQPCLWRIEHGNRIWIYKRCLLGPTTV